MKSDTRDRILGAARTEFSHHGLAGARVDRIAVAAKASKERLYAYFGDKDKLFEAVLEAGFARFVDSVPFTPRDLTAYALASFSHLSTTDGDLRMLLWAQLQGDGQRIASAEQTMLDRIQLVEKAQADGVVDSTWRADDLLTMIFGVVFSWATMPHSETDVDETEIGRRRRVIGDAVGRLVDPR
ncbi:TetR family transcriptional regulator [Rhodococcoides trifolii]|uniref:TetR family transcriptional regulator n=1 Tax=Rhodococcoides trifolii TaxID=908250 RepID=A0A917FP55_9NOCA|nr:TetR family transcriptional regulator [Rhodococcus trifolii]GGF92197.1 TetR family transcriptional regulator [Rhodococcus trifolii]